MDEKRKHIRQKVGLKSEVTDNEGLTYSKTVDVSKGGLFISTPDPVGIGSDINLSIQLPGEKSIELKGTVKWVRNDEVEGERAGMGIEFSEITADQIEALKDYTE